MGLQDYCFDGKRELDLKELPTGAWDEGCLLYTSRCV